MRIETDLFGEKQLEDNIYYGINTARALENFDLKQRPANRHLVRAIVIVKKAAARTYRDLKVREDGIYEAVIAACDKILTGRYDDQFPVQALQGGAGTSLNMNVNEVIANVALEELGKPLGSYDMIHPIDDVNRGQSTNDVYPTALRIAAIENLRTLSEECAKLQTALQEKENEFEHIKKLGRTELMDAVEISLGGEFGAYAQAIARDRWRIYKVEERLRQVNIGGTAVGVATNAARKYRFQVIEELRKLTDIGLAVAEYPMDITQNNDVFVEVSGLLKALSVNLMKIANDFRLMNSGPNGGIGEITLPMMQQGSSIMPGKVNPVIAEMTAQCAMKVMANDTGITMAAAHGEFELNAYLPLIADSLLESLELMTQTVHIFRIKCVEGIIANEKRCGEHLEQSYAFAASYIDAVGYDAVSQIVKEHSPGEAKAWLEQLKNNKKA